MELTTLSLSFTNCSLQEHYNPYAVLCEIRCNCRPDVVYIQNDPAERELSDAIENQVSAVSTGGKAYPAAFEPATCFGRPDKNGPSYAYLVSRETYSECPLEVTGSYSSCQLPYPTLFDPYHSRLAGERETGDIASFSSSI
jgi:hypothetical protein